MGCDSHMSDFNCDCAPTYPNGAASPIPPFWGFSAFTPTIPKLYWNVKSQEQRILNLFDLLNKLVCYCDSMGLQIDVNAQDIADLQKAMQELKDGGLLDYYEKQIYQWIQDNMEALIKKALLQFVTLGINDDGYLVLYRPDSWNDIIIDWGAVYGRSDYGRIILRMDVNGSGIDNTYSYSLAQNTTLKKLIADLEVNAKRTDAAYDTLFTNLTEDVTIDGTDQ